MQLHLKVVAYRKTPPAESIEVKIDREPAVIGRESQSDVTMVLPDPSGVISRRHARIEYRDGQYFITDISQNGVLITDSGESMEFNVPYAIENQDRFTIGDYEVAADLNAAGKSGIAFEEQVQGNASAGPPGGWQDAAKKPSWWSSDGISDNEEAAGRSDRMSLEERSRPSFKDIPMAPPDTTESGPQDKLERPGSPDHESDTPGSQGYYVPGQTKSKVDSGARVGGAAANKKPSSSNDYIPGGFTPVGGVRDHETSDTSTPSPQVEDAGEPILKEDEQEPTETTQETSPPPTPEALEQVMREVLAILGVPDLPVRAADAPEVLQTIAAILRAVLTETIEVLRTREKFKYEHRITGSVLYNNPLKFALSVEDAVDRMLWPRGKGQLPPVKAVHQTFMDIIAHQAALMGAAEGAVRGAGSLARFDPKRLERDWFQEISGLEHHLVIKRKAKLWDLYVANYRGLANRATDAFEKEFEEKFTRAYAEQLASLRAAGIGGPADN